MKGMLRERVTPLMTSAMKMACCSLSMTHGPAIRKRFPDPMRMDSTWKETLMRVGSSDHSVIEPNCARTGIDWHRDASLAIERVYQPDLGRVSQRVTSVRLHEPPGLTTNI